MRLFGFRTTLLSPLFLLRSDAVGDWYDAWGGTIRTLDNAFEVDPNDSRTMMRGSGSITLGNGICKMSASPRLYISHSSDVAGWENTDFQVYGMFVQAGNLKSYSGLTLVTRSNHDLYSTDGCEAMGYYARIYWQTGELSFQKEYYHGSGGTVYSPSKRVPYFVNGVPMNTWIGMRFTATTTGSNNDEVQLKLYLDEVGDGSWVLRHSYTDKSGEWLSTSSSTVPAECAQSDGDTVLGPRNVCFLRSDGSSDTEVHWKDALVLNELDPLPTSSPAPSTSPIPIVCEGIVPKSACNDAFGGSVCKWSGHPNKGSCGPVDGGGAGPGPPSGCGGNNAPCSTPSQNTADCCSGWCKANGKCSK